MSRPIRFLVVLLSILIAERSPAPIVEENPTPAPEQTAKPKTKQTTRSSAASDVSTENKAPSSKAKNERAGNRYPFDGTWKGALPFGMFGTLHLTLVVSNQGTAVTESGGLAGTVHFKATNDGKTVTWRSSVLSEIAWTLTPNNSGANALVTAKSAFIGNQSATFQRAASGQ